MKFVLCSVVLAMLSCLVATTFILLNLLPYAAVATFCMGFCLLPVLFHGFSGEACID